MVVPPAVEHSFSKATGVKETGADVGPLRSGDLLGDFGVRVAFIAEFSVGVVSPAVELAFSGGTGVISAGADAFPVRGGPDLGRGRIGVSGGKAQLAKFVAAPAIKGAFANRAGVRLAR